MTADVVERRYAPRGAAYHRRARRAWILSGIVSTALIVTIRLVWPAASWLFEGPVWPFPAIMTAYHHGWLRRHREPQP